MDSQSTLLTTEFWHDFTRRNRSDNGSHQGCSNNRISIGCCPLPGRRWCKEGMTRGPVYAPPHVRSEGPASRWELTRKAVGIFAVACVSFRLHVPMVS